MRSGTHEPTLIYETLHGSRAYGLDRAGSDTDLKGVIIGPRDWYFSYQSAPEQIEVRGGDHVRFVVNCSFPLRSWRLCERKSWGCESCGSEATPR